MTLESPITRLDHFEAGARGVASRNVPGTLDVFTTHFPRFPVLPGVLILGDLFRVASLFLERETSRAWKPAGVRQVRWRHYVQPGDRMEVSVTLTSVDGASAELRGSASVDGRVVATATALRLVAEVAD